jgi:hypothetical protein
MEKLHWVHVETGNEIGNWQHTSIWLLCLKTPHVGCKTRHDDVPCGVSIRKDMLTNSLWSISVSRPGKRDVLTSQGNFTRAKAIGLSWYLQNHSPEIKEV